MHLFKTVKNINNSMLVPGAETIQMGKERTQAHQSRGNQTTDSSGLVWHGWGTTAPLLAVTPPAVLLEKARD